MNHDVAEWLLLQCSQKYKSGWLGSRTPDSMTLQSGASSLEWLRNSRSGTGIILTDRLEERLQGVANFTELLQRFQLKGVREDSRLGLLGWLEGRYALTLMHQPPTPEELLELQCRGERVVTLHLTDQGPIGRHAGPLEFLLHDLEHAHKFFGQNTFHGQKRFFNLLRDALNAGLFQQLCSNSKFRVELEYLMSDMNSHPLHLFKYLKAIVLEALPEKRVAELDRWCDRLFQVWQLPEPVFEAAQRINYPALENNQARLRVSDFFAYN